MSDILPKESEGQEIGKKAVRAFKARLPNSWCETDLAGDSDYGLDFIVQTKDENSLITANFYLQLKGTSSPNFVNNGQELSYQFNSSTLNYYRNSEPCIMVAVVNLSVSEKPRECPVYYRWLDEDFLDSIKHLCERNDTVAIRVPVTNEINEDLDILPYYKKRLATRDSLIDLRRAIEENSLTPVTHIESLTNAIKAKPVFLEATRDDSGAPWLTNPEDIAAGKLCKVQEAITNNKLLSANSLLDKVGDTDKLTAHERAEYLSLKAAILSLTGHEHDAYELYKQAFQIHPSSRYKINFYESTFRLDIIPNNDTLEEYIETLDSNNFRESLLKAKYLAILGRENAAIRELDLHPPEKNIIGKLLTYNITGNTSEFDNIANTALPDSLNDRQKFIYHGLIGRRYFYLGIGSTNEEVDKNIIPAKGKSEYNFELLRKSYENLDEALNISRENGFPYDTYILLDVAASVYSIFNNEDKLIAFLDEMMSNRSNVALIVTQLLMLRFNKRQYEDVIQIINSLETKTSDEISLFIAAHYHLGKKSSVLAIMDEYEDKILRDKPQNYDTLFCIAAQCAYDTLDDTKEEQYLSKIKSFKNGKELLSIYEYLKDCNNHPEHRKDNNKSLYDTFLTLERPYSIAQQLYSNLDVSDPDESVMICELANSITQTRELYPEEYVAYGHALLINKRWQELLNLCHKKESNNELDNFWSLLKASALDGLGQSGEALDVLDHAVSSDRRSFERAENYVHLCIRLGFFERAEEKLKNLLETSPPEKQASIIESLMFIYSSDAEPSERLMPTLIRYGKLADQDNEAQEGKYLVSFLTMTNGANLDISPYLDDFRQRLERFTKKFPSSILLRKAEISTESNGSKILHDLRMIAGISDEQVKTWKRNRNLIKNGKLPVPFSLLYKFLDDVSDVYAAWVYSKHIGKNNNEYQLQHSRLMTDEDLNKIGTEFNQVVLDETSLLVLNEIGILDKVIANIKEIIINKSTYNNLSKSSHAVMGSIYYTVPKSIVSTLGEYISNIQIKGSKSDTANLLDEYESILNELTSGVICTDDLYLSEFLKHSGHKTLNSVNLIDWLHENNILSKDAWIHAFESLCSLGIGNTAIKESHITESLAYNLINHSDTPILDTGFCSIFDSQFTGKTPYDGSIQDLSRVFSNLLNAYDSNIDICNLDNLVNVWLVRYPVAERITIISVWFVLSCALVTYNPLSAFVKTGKGESRLWSLVKKLTTQIDTRYTMEITITRISDVILNLDSTQASDVYDKVKFAFTEGTRESDLFTKIYSEKAIQKRIAEMQHQ